MNGMEHSCRFERFFSFFFFFFWKSQSQGRNTLLDKKEEIFGRKYITTKVSFPIKKKVCINIRFNDSIRLIGDKNYFPILFSETSFEKKKIFFLQSDRFVSVRNYVGMTHRKLWKRLWATIPRIRYGAWWFQLCS